MDRIFITIVICANVFFVKPYFLGNSRSVALVYIIAGIIASVTAESAEYNELIEDIAEIKTKFDINTHMTPDTNIGMKPTTATTEEPIPDEWKLKSEYRIKCLDEVSLAPRRVIRLLSSPVWTDTDVDMKKWILCVLNKMDLMTKEGVFKLDVAMSKFYKKDKDEVESLIEYCLPKKTMPAYEIAWKYVKCHKLAKGKFAAISIY